MKKIFGLTFLIVMLVGLVGCKPLTGDGVCVHTNIKDAEIGTVLENGEVVSAVTSAWYGYNESGELDLVKTEVETHYVCTDCGKVFKKNVAFFTTDDHKTTIGKATDVTLTRYKQLPINEELIKFYNSYYDKVVKNKDKSGYISYCNCKCIHDVDKGNTCSCNDTCDCGDPDYCVRSNGNKVYFGSYYITY
ncbi:MAG: hypothetical protein MJ174_00320 [Treponema sp.]|nr:hypothetical protein [Treponema sp.]